MLRKNGRLFDRKHRDDDEIPKARYSPSSTECEHSHTLVRRMITRAAKAWDHIMPVGTGDGGPIAVLRLSKGTSMQIVLGPVLVRKGGYALDCWTPEEGLSRGHTYRRVEDAHYARNVEIRSRNKGSSDQTIACSTVDEFVRLTRLRRFDPAFCDFRGASE